MLSSRQCLYKEIVSNLSIREGLQQAPLVGFDSLIAMEGLLLIHSLIVSMLLVFLYAQKESMNSASLSRSMST
jgi:hypothetical protein